MFELLKKCFQKTTPPKTYHWEVVDLETLHQPLSTQQQADILAMLHMLVTDHHFDNPDDRCLFLELIRRLNVQLTCIDVRQDPRSNNQHDLIFVYQLSCANQSVCFSILGKETYFEDDWEQSERLLICQPPSTRSRLGPLK